MAPGSGIMHANMGPVQMSRFWQAPHKQTEEILWNTR